MGKYSRDVIAQVLAGNDIVDIIGGALDLKASGHGRFVALCPFHHEKTPSFSISRERQMYYCFGCGKSGDAVKFLCEHEGMTFAEALRRLADRAGVRLPELTEKDEKDDFRRARLLELGAFAAKTFREMLADPLKGGLGRKYIKSRELRAEIMTKFGLGYAPEGWSALTDAARTAGFKDDVLELSGLVRRGDAGRCYDFFRNRLMFPIRDASGNTVAFGGRDLGGDAAAKYVNTPENPVYKKGRILYGLYEARESLRREKRAVLVEGYFDLLRCVEAGVENVVASCGTALTPEQASLMRRYASEVVIVYDGDRAGIRAALRGVAILTTAGLTVRALLLPDGKDPDDYVLAHGAEAFRAQVEGAADFVTFYVRMNEDRLSSIEGRTDVAQEVLTLLLGVEDGLRREEYLKRIAHELQVSEFTVRREFEKRLRQRAASPPPSSAHVAGVGPETAPGTAQSVGSHGASCNQEDQVFVAILLNNEPMRELARRGLAGVNLQPGTLSEVLKVVFEDARSDAGQRIETDAARAFYAAAANSYEADSEKAHEIVTKRVARLKRDALAAEGFTVQEALRDAERNRDLELLNDLLSRKYRIRKEMEKLGAT